jgi:hypothetical protein
MDSAGGAVSGPDGIAPPSLALAAHPRPQPMTRRPSARRVDRGARMIQFGIGRLFSAVYCSASSSEKTTLKVTLLSLFSTSPSERDQEGRANP